VKKIFVYILSFILICFLIPILCTNKKEIKEVITIKEKEEIQEIEEKVYDYGQYNKIKLLHTNAGEVEELDLDTYLLGVVSSEMPASFEQEALNAQSIVARTYTIYKIANGSKHENADICDDSSCCQAWISKEERFEKWNVEERENNWSKIETAVNNTNGIVLGIKNELITTKYDLKLDYITKYKETNEEYNDRGVYYLKNKNETGTQVVPAEWVDENNIPTNKVLDYTYLEFMSIYGAKYLLEKEQSQYDLYRTLEYYYGRDIEYYTINQSSSSSGGAYGCSEFNMHGRAAVCFYVILLRKFSSRRLECPKGA